MCDAEIAAICTTKAPPGEIAGAVVGAGCVAEDEFAADEGAGRAVVDDTGAVFVCADAGSVFETRGVVVTTAGVGAGGVVADDVVVGDGAGGEPGEGLKLSKLDPSAPAGSVSFVAAGSGAFVTVVDLRPML